MGIRVFDRQALGRGGVDLDGRDAGEVDRVGCRGAHQGTDPGAARLADMPPDQGAPVVAPVVITLP
jgi:hypothetical protein